MQRIAITSKPSCRLGTIEEPSIRPWVRPWGKLWNEPSQHSRISPAERLLEQTQAHITAHDAWLEACARLLHVIDDQAAHFLIEQLVQSRTTHRRLLAHMATALRDSLYWTKSEGALPCPEPGAAAPRARHSLQRVTELIRAERELARSGRRLGDSFGGIACGLNALLLRAMALDSERHDRMLRFVQRLLKSQVRQSDATDDSAEDEPVPGRVLLEAAELIREPVRVPEAAAGAVNHL